MTFRYGPMLWVVYLSFTGYDIVTGPKFIGLTNYVNIFKDPIFLQALNNTLIYIVGSTIAITVLGLGLALSFNTGIKASLFL
jgi:multiple sugar transport system permease protein